MTLRTRLTLSYAAIVLGVLAVLSAALVWDEPRVGLTLLDADLERDAVTVEGVLLHEAATGQSRDNAVHAMLAALKLPGRGVAIYTPDGSLIGERWDGLDPVEPVVVDVVGQSGPRTVQTASGSARLYERRIGAAGDWVVVVVRSAESVSRETTILERALLFAFPIAVAVASLGGWFVLTRSVLPVERMARESAGITAAEPGRRLSVPHSPTDLHNLARAFNDLLDRLSAAFQGQRVFMADASHELRTPASVARTAAEVTLSAEHRSEAEYREALTIVQEQTARMARLIDDMLLLARADMERQPIERSDFYLDEIVDESARSLRVLAAPRTIAIAVDCPIDVQMHGDEALVRQLLVNLIGNAVAHTPPGGTVRIGVSVEGGRAIIDVIDHGPGVPEADRLRIFERFVKLDPARLRPGGAGLGLPIARWIAEAHGGSLELAATGPAGSRFRAVLPLFAREAPPKPL